MPSFHGRHQKRLRSKDCIVSVSGCEADIGKQTGSPNSLQHERKSSFPTSQAGCVSLVGRSTSPSGKRSRLSHCLTRTRYSHVTNVTVLMFRRSYLVATQVQGIISLNDANYTAKAWHATLMVIAVAAIAILFNTFFAKKLPLIEGVILIIHVFGFFGILVRDWKTLSQLLCEILN